jgi:hypothetical protein
MGIKILNTHDIEKISGGGILNIVVYNVGE